jgi:hypothetical protein
MRAGWAMLGGCSRPLRENIVLLSPWALAFDFLVGKEVAMVRLSRNV